MKNLFFISLLVMFFSTKSYSKEVALVDREGAVQETIIQPPQRSWDELKALMDGEVLKESFAGLIDCAASHKIDKTEAYAQNILYNDYQWYVHTISDRKFCVQLIAPKNEFLSSSDAKKDNQGHAIKDMHHLRV